MAVTVTWDGSFETVPPPTGEAVSAGAARITTLKVAVRERAEREHIGATADTNSDHGVHRPGSAMAYWQTTAPTKLPDGVANLANDTKSKGRVWVDSDDDDRTPYVYGIDRGTSATNAWLPLGTVPVGAVVGWCQGYFSSGGATGFVRGLSALQANWKVADGSAPNEAKSPVWNTAGRYLPKIDDSRFLMGGARDPSDGTVMVGGGTVTLIAANLPAHTHDSGTLLISSHTHFTLRGENSATVTDIDSTHAPQSWLSSVSDAAYRMGYTSGLGANVGLTSGPNNSGLTGDTGAGPGSSTPASIAPQYMRVTFIVRIY